MTHKPPSFLKMHRRKSALTQDEMWFLLRSINKSTEIGRMERGQRPEKIELLLAYHFLFETSIESMFELRLPDIQAHLLHNAQILLSALKKKKNVDRMDSFKITFLEDVVERLSKKQEPLKAPQSLLFAKV